MAGEYDLLSGWGEGAYWGPALTVGGDTSYLMPRLEDSQPANAIDSMQPIAAETQDDAYGWLKDLAKTAVGYVIAKDAQQNAIVPPTQSAYAQTAGQATGQAATRAASQQSSGGGGMLVLLLLGGLAVYALKE